MSLLQPYVGEMYAYQVLDLVGNVRNDWVEYVGAVV